MSLTNPDRLFPVDPRLRDMARAFYESVRDLPIISPHGHCEPRWFAENKRFPNPAELLVVPDHYLLRMLASQGVPLTDLGVLRSDGGKTEEDPRAIWQRFAAHYHLFRGTPSAIWLDHSFEHLFGIDEVLSADTANAYYDHIDKCLGRDEFRPRALFEQFNVELLATTDAATDQLPWHQQLRDSGWKGRIVTTYRPDAAVDPEFPGFAKTVAELGEITREDTSSWAGYLAAHRARRAYF
ncbi:MAG: glucuronate isomerase, partial [Pseudomonadota bacterium]|nr:glucuronate isomerase [Pseudomonadota bacterium]